MRDDDRNKLTCKDRGQTHTTANRRSIDISSKIGEISIMKQAVAEQNHYQPQQYQKDYQQNDECLDDLDLNFPPPMLPLQMGISKSWFDTNNIFSLEFSSCFCSTDLR